MELDNFSFVIPVEYCLHTTEKPFCYDETCPCKEDQDAIAQVAGWIANGLMTAEEATEFVKGKGI